MSENKNLKENNSEKDKKTFWQGYNLVLVLLSLGIPIILLSLNLLSYFEVLGYKINVGLNLGNSIALLSAGAAITGTLYSNYQNGLRNEKQIYEAGNRLTKQINNQNTNFKEQLEANKENLKNQLIHDDKTKVILKICATMNTFQKSRKTLKNNPFSNSPITKIMKEKAKDYDKIHTEDNDIFYDKLNVYVFLKEITNDIYSYYYIPNNMKKYIKEYINLVENEAYKISGLVKLESKDVVIKYFSEVIEKIKNDPLINLTINNEIIARELLGNVFCNKSVEINDCLNKIYEEIESELE